jgi:hypothetical protein
LMNIDKPPIMTGKSLINWYEKNNDFNKYMSVFFL